MLPAVIGRLKVELELATIVQAKAVLLVARRVYDCSVRTGLALGRHDEAIEFYRRAHDLDAKHHLAEANLSALLRSTNVGPHSNLGLYSNISARAASTPHPAGAWAEPLPASLRRNGRDL